MSEPDHELLGRAKSLRRNLTDAERRLWSKLRNRRFAHFKFRRQVPLGRYIVDFVCFEQRLVVELDGGQHTLQADYDARRTHWLEEQGFHVVRFWNHELWQDEEAVDELIWQRLHEHATVSHRAPSPPTPLPQGERGD